MSVKMGISELTVGNPHRDTDDILLQSARPVLLKLSVLGILVQGKDSAPTGELNFICLCSGVRKSAFLTR